MTVLCQTVQIAPWNSILLGKYEDMFCLWVEKMGKAEQLISVACFARSLPYSGTEFEGTVYPTEFSLIEN